jgi:hypothetical protein
LHLRAISSVMVSQLIRSLRSATESRSYWELHRASTHIKAHTEMPLGQGNSHQFEKRLNDENGVPRSTAPCLLKRRTLSCSRSMSLLPMPSTLLEKELRSLSPRATYADLLTAACRRSYYQLLRIQGAAWSAQRILTAIFSVF